MNMREDKRSTLLVLTHRDVPLFGALYFNVCFVLLSPRKPYFFSLGGAFFILCHASFSFEIRIQ